MNTESNFSINIKKNFLSPPGRQLSINSVSVSYGKKKLLSGSINRIRYGMVQLYINGIKANRVYKIELQDNRNEKISVSFQSAMLFKTNKKIEAKYYRIIDALWQNITKPLVNRYLEELHRGETVEVGPVRINHEGINMRYSRFFRKHEKFIPWESVCKYMKRGRLVLYDRNNKKVKVSINTLKTWNAVVLNSLLEFLWEEGRAFHLKEKLYRV